MPESKPVALVIGASRGIGRQIAIDLATQHGYSVVVSAKSTSDAYAPTLPFPPDPNSPQSTISTVEREIRQAGGEATAIPADVRDHSSVEELVRQTVDKYKHLDVLIYNPGAIWWASVQDTPMKRFRLMQQVNVEGLYGAVQAALPHLKKASSSSSSLPLRRRGGGGGRIVVVSPPIYSRFFRGKTAYAMGKVAMSVLTKGLGMDFERQGLVGQEGGEGGGRGMAITSLWPAVAIQSAATQTLTLQTPSLLQDLRKPTIFADAVHAVLAAPAALVNGQLLLDEDFLREHRGVTDFSAYAVVVAPPRGGPRGGGGEDPPPPPPPPRRIMPYKLPDLSVEEQEDEGRRVESVKKIGKARL